jgi:hypothetical protein
MQRNALVIFTLPDVRQLRGTYVVVRYQPSELDVKVRYWDAQLRNGKLRLTVLTHRLNPARWFAWMLSRPQFRGRKCVRAVASRHAPQSRPDRVCISALRIPKPTLRSLKCSRSIEPLKT